MAATNKERLDNAELRLDQVEAALGLHPPKPKSPFRQFRGHLWQQIKAHWKAVVPLVALSIAIAGWFVGGWFKYYLDHRYDFIDGMIATNLNARGGVRETLAAVQQTVNRTDATLAALQPFIHDVISRQFENASNLPAATIGKRLPAIEHLLTAAKDQLVRVDPKAVERLSAKLQGAQISASGFWPAVGSLISYRSLFVGQDVARLAQSKLPTCTDRDPGGMEVDSVKVDPTLGDKDHSQATISIENAKYADCTLTLDSPEQADKINWVLKHRMNRITFTHCVIVYRGGPINITMELNNEPRKLRYYDKTGKLAISSEVKVSGPTLAFTNCLFDFALPTTPTEPGQSFAKSVLTQNGPSIILYSFSPHS